MKKTGTSRSVASAALVATFLFFFARSARAAYEREQLAIESQLQQRIENILAKTLPPSSYLVTVKVEMENRRTPASGRSRARGKRPGTNPFLDGNRFVLPGVPEKKEFVETPDTTPSEPVTSAFTAETLVRHIAISILVAPDVTAEQIRGMRDIISASVPFNPLRGDEMDIQNSSLLKRANSAPASSVAPPVERVSVRSNSVFSNFNDRANWPLLVLIGAALVGLVVFGVFLFGPVRAFLNRLLNVLPRVGEQAAYAVNNSAKNNPQASAPVAAVLAGSGHGTSNGSRRGETDMPFDFIREDQLNKLPLLFKQMPPNQSALVLAYLPPEWASRVLSGLETTVQTTIMAELSQAQEVPPEVVKEVESQVKGKLPYLVGGVDWIQSVYQLTQPQTQRALLGTLHEQSPDLARALRLKTFFFEDIAVIGPGPLRLLVQELGYPTTAMALRDEKPELREAVLRRLPAGTREIVKQELELSNDDKAGMIDAKARLVTLARRMIIEGRIVLTDRKAA